PASNSPQPGKGLSRLPPGLASATHEKLKWTPSDTHLAKPSLLIFTRAEGVRAPHHLSGSFP
ncbi:hypothetical protein PO909_021411, partial [Leuciscus waleckii]